MLDNTHREFQNYIPYIFSYSSEQYIHPIKTFTFQVTDACNLCCTYCYQTNKSQHVLDFDIAKNMIDYLFDNKSNPEFYFYEKDCTGIIFEFIGGEPLLQIDLIEKIMGYCDFKFLSLPPEDPWILNHMYSLCSNGMLYFEPKVQQLKEKYKNFFSINITVDGNKALHDSCRLTPSGEGSYDIAIKAALHNAKKWGSNGTKITLSPDNVQYTFDAISNMINLGFNFISINPAYEEGWTDKHGTILYYELKKLTEWIYNNNLEEKCWIRIFEERDFQPFSSDRNKNWCGSNSCMLAIDWKGEIYPCIRFMESSLNNEQPPLVIGNINDGLFTTEAQKNIQKELDSLTVVSQSTQECLDCSICSGCSWCTAYNYQRYGTLNKRATFICPIQIASALGALYFHKFNNPNYNKINVDKEKALRIIDEVEWNLLMEGGKQNGV